MPAKGRNNLIDVRQATETLELKEEIKVECKTVGLIHATDGAPGIRTDQHPGLRDEVGPPRQYSRGPRACPTNP